MRRPLVHVRVIFPGPGERLVLRPLHPVQRDPPRLQHRQMLLREIMPDDPDQRHRPAEKRRRQRRIRRRSAQQVRPLRLRSLHMVDGDGPADHDGGWRMADADDMGGAGDWG